ncbi:MAG TPA: GNAT family N-acetyltransferase [Ktedonobacteraceae bacterium]|jgi:ribosomal-protein-alanine N-acetyltransferase|nr:GNAT family N-acetyltransferase [Ktedonobacteraceae bacterium]
MQILETQRLKLIPFTLELKKITLANRARLPEMLGVAIPDAWPGPDLLEALPFFIEAMEQDPAGLVWDGIIIHKADQVAIGGIGFHGGPDEAGMVEIGYNIIPAYEGQGYATEMVRCVIDWAFHTPGIEVITAECLENNIGSIRVLEKVRMHRLSPEGNRLKWELRRSL